MRISSSVKRTILNADSVEQAWELFESLLSNPNGYTDAAILENARAYVAASKTLSA